MSKNKERKRIIELLKSRGYSPKQAYDMAQEALKAKRKVV